MLRNVHPAALTRSRAIPPAQAQRLQVEAQNSHAASWRDDRASVFLFRRTIFSFSEHFLIILL